MQRVVCRGLPALLAIAAMMAVPGAGPKTSRGLTPAGWPGFAYSAQHMAQPGVAAQTLTRIKWSTPVDLHPQYSGTALLIHYGSPVITPASTVVIPVKTGPDDGFRVEARRGADGSLLWSMDTDYSVPPHDWGPECGPTLTPTGGVAIPASGGRVLVRLNADAPSSRSYKAVFYGAANYASDPATYDANVKINTPITSDPDGNLYFGFVVLGPTPIGLQSGIARITPAGAGSYTTAAAAASDPNIAQVPHNCAPALSIDGSRVYIAVRDGNGAGYLLCLNSATLAPLHRVHLQDPSTGNDASIIDDGTASPTIGPDGHVFYGTLENPWWSNHLRGWMLHFDADLAQEFAPGAFGWDDTVAVVSRDAVPGYTGPSRYLLLSKYNNYVEGGGDGVNKVAVLDPSATQADPITGTTVMREVMTRAGPTPDTEHPSSPNAVREWCINSAAVDRRGHSGMVNSEDGKLYRWDFNTNTLTEAMTLTSGLGQAYTPTIIGPDGTVYAIGNATLFAVGE